MVRDLKLQISRGFTIYDMVLVDMVKNKNIKIAPVKPQVKNEICVLLGKKNRLT